VWTIVNKNKKGSLNALAFATALKLVGLIQAGKEPILEDLPKYPCIYIFFLRIS
jgi:hypothetical protein